MNIKISKSLLTTISILALVSSGVFWQNGKASASGNQQSATWNSQANFEAGQWSNSNVKWSNGNTPGLQLDNLSMYDGLSERFSSSQLEFDSPTVNSWDSFSAGLADVAPNAAQDTLSVPLQEIDQNGTSGNYLKVTNTISKQPLTWYPAGEDPYRVAYGINNDAWTVNRSLNNLHNNNQNYDYGSNGGFLINSITHAYNLNSGGVGSVDTRRLMINGCTNTYQSCQVSSISVDQYNHIWVGIQNSNVIVVLDGNSFTNNSFPITSSDVLATIQTNYQSSTGQYNVYRLSDVMNPNSAKIYIGKCSDSVIGTQCNTYRNINNSYRQTYHINYDYYSFTQETATASCSPTGSVFDYHSERLYVSCSQGVTISIKTNLNANQTGALAAVDQLYNFNANDLANDYAGNVWLFNGSIYRISYQTKTGALLNGGTNYGAAHGVVVKAGGTDFPLDGLYISHEAGYSYKPGFFEFGNVDGASLSGQMLFGGDRSEIASNFQGGGAIGYGANGLWVTYKNNKYVWNVGGGGGSVSNLLDGYFQSVNSVPGNVLVNAFGDVMGNAINNTYAGRISFNVSSQPISLPNNPGYSCGAGTTDEIKACLAQVGLTKKIYVNARFEGNGFGSPVLKDFTLNYTPVEIIGAKISLNKTNAYVGLKPDITLTAQNTNSTDPNALIIPPATFTVYCDQNDTNTNILPNYVYRAPSNQSTLILPSTCLYDHAGVYHPKVIIEKTGLAPAAAITEVTITDRPTLSAALSVNPSEGTAPFTPMLKTEISGNATGTINTTLWYNCNDPSTDLAKVTTSCGDPTNPAVGQKLNGEAWPGSTKEISHQFATSGIYTPKVIIERGDALPAEARTTLKVNPAPKVSPCTPFGDVNGDGVISTDDVNLINSFLSGATTLTDEQKTRADVTNDSLVSTADSNALTIYLSENSYTFPICQKVAIEKISPCPPYGDVSNNGKVGPDDIQKIQSFLSGGSLTDDEKLRADVNADQNVSILDENIINLYLASGAVFPVCASENISVALTVTPNSDLAPRSIELKATIAGNSLGNVNYYFWFNCDNAGTDPQAVGGSCGVPNSSGNEFGQTFENLSGQLTKTMSHFYKTPGNYKPKVIVQKGSSLAESRADLHLDTLGTKLSPCPPLGDIFTQNHVGQDEYAAIVENVLGGGNLTDDEKSRADVDKSGAVDLNDAVLVMNYLKGNTPTFSGCNAGASNVPETQVVIGPGKPLTIHGSIVANQIEFNRRDKNNKNYAMTILYDAKILDMSLPGFDNFASIILNK